MGRHHLYSVAVTAMLVGTQAFAGGRGQANFQNVAPPHPPHPAGGMGQHALTSHSQGHERARDGRGRHFDRRGFRNAVVAYPWWLYNGPDYTNPYIGPYGGSSTPVTPAPAFASTPPAPDYNALRASLAAIQSREQAALEASPQWVAVNAQIDQAQADLKAANANLARSLLGREDYRAALHAKQAAHDLAAMLHDRSASDGEIFAIAQQGLDASRTSSRIEQEAAANDVAMREAKARLQSAAAARAAIKAQFREHLLKDPDWIAAKERLSSPQ